MWLNTVTFVLRMAKTREISVDLVGQAMVGEGVSGGCCLLLLSGTGKKQHLP